MTVAPHATPVARPADPLSPAALAADPERALALVLLAGAAATVAFDLYGQAISPLLGGANLAPVPLARQSLQALLGWDSEAAAQLVHYLTGLLAYPLGWLLLARPLGARLSLPRPLAAAAWGVALWVFALWFMASVISGNPPFLGFSGIAWVALTGHVLFALVAAWTLESLSRRL